MAEYEYCTTFYTIQIKPGIGDASGDELSRELTMRVGTVTNTVSEAAQQLEGGGWEIISHEITRLDRHLAISYLLRRPKRSTARS